MGKSHALLLAFVLGCGSEEPPAAKTPPAPPKKAMDKNAWKEIETPVPVGKKLACDKLLPAAKLSAALGKPVVVKDDSARDSEATAVCTLVTVDKKGKEGDELCKITVGCWAQWSVAEVKKKCDARGDQTSTDIGAFTCVQTVTAGTKERHIVTVLEPDTRCRVIANAGPYTYDEAATRGCAKAVVDVIDRESLKQ